jgi:hypothetical protein
MRQLLLGSGFSGVAMLSGADRQGEGRVQMRRMLLAAVAPLALAVLALGATTAAAADTPCTGALTGTINGNVSAGPGCDLSGVTMVRGNVKVNPGGSLTIAFGSSTAITGNVQSQGATLISIFAGSIGGNVEIQNGVANVLVVFATVGGNVQVHNNAGSFSSGMFGIVDVAENTVKGNVEVHNNSATGSSFNLIQVAGNGPVYGAFSIGGNLQVHDNQATGGTSVNEVNDFQNLVGGNLEVHNNAATGPSGSFNATDVSGNTVKNNLDCHNDTPAATDTFTGVNTAKQKKGECASL